jgi:hypothetical protein
VTAKAGPLARAHGCSRENPCLCRATKPRHPDSDCRRRLRSRRSAQGRRRVVEAARSTPAARPLPFPQEPTPGARSEREPASEAGGRVGVGPGLLRRPPSSESHGGAHSSSRLAPTTSTQASQRRTSPLVSARVPPQDPLGTAAPTRQPNRGWARRVPGRRGVGRFGAWPAPPALPGSRGCRRRSTSARWRPSRSAPPCPGPE